MAVFFPVHNLLFKLEKIIAGDQIRIFLLYNSIWTQTILLKHSRFYKASQLWFVDTGELTILLVIYRILGHTAKEFA